MLLDLEQVLDKIIKGVKSYGFSCKGWIESPLKGAEGNIEFLACFCRTTVNCDPSEAEKQHNDLVSNGHSHIDVQ